MIAAGAERGRRRAEPWPPQAWRGFSLGLLLGALGAAALLALAGGVASGRHAAADGLATVGHSDAARRWTAFRDAAGLSAREDRQARTALADAEETRAAALAYFGATEDDRDRRDDGAGEVDEVVGGALQTRLTETLGARRAALAEHHLGPLATFVADASSGR